MTMAARLGSKKILDIECLRALAIMFTLMAHLRFLYNELPTWLDRVLSRLDFWGGVDLFFVISGFVIGKNIIPQWRALSDDVSERLRFVLGFWLRRVNRLLPAAWFWAFVSLAVVGVLHPKELAANVIDVVAALLQVYNLHAYVCSLGLATCSHAAVGVYWSLSLEEQIYIFVPVVMAFFRRRIELLFVAMLATALALQAFAPQLSSFMRFDGFCWGMLVALLYDQPKLHALVDDILLRPLGRLKYLISGLMLVAIPVIGKGGVVLPMTYPLTALCATGLVLLGSYDRNLLGIPQVLRKGLVYLGGRSYSIYLLHVPVLSVLNRVSGGHGQSHNPLRLLLWPTFSMAVIIGLSELSYRLIEERWRHPRNETNSRAAIKVAASAG